MSLARKFAAVGQKATAVFEEETVLNLRSGASFNAKIVPIGDTSLNTELGIDARATDIFYVRDRNLLGKIRAGDNVSALGAKFMILPKKDPDNPGSLHLEYQCMKLVPGKDS